jgi:hypothetical protein
MDRGLGDYAQLERLGKHANDQAKLYDIDREAQIQSLILMIPAWKEIKISTDPSKDRRTKKFHRHRGTPTKTRLVARQITR